MKDQEPKQNKKIDMALFFAVSALGLAAIIAPALIDKDSDFCPMSNPICQAEYFDADVIATLFAPTAMPTITPTATATPTR